MLEAFTQRAAGLPEPAFWLTAVALFILVCLVFIVWRARCWKRKWRELAFIQAQHEERLALERRHEEEKNDLLAKAQERLEHRFRMLAQEIFDEKSRALSEQNREKLEDLLKPFRDQVRSFRDRIDTIFVEDTRERTSLKQEILQLRDLNQQLNIDAKNLTEAITGNRKFQGTWGEVVLERLLEQSGLRRGHEYETQVGLRDQENKLFKPDIILHLPENKDIVIDSKVSLTHWARFVSSADEEDRQQAMKAHIQSLRRHLAELQAKDYSALQGLKSVDFVLMFVPIDAAFVTAMHYDEKIIPDMYSHKIIIVTPTTLLATLKTVEHIWRLEKQNQNAVEIAVRAGQFYDKLCGFLEDMEKLGRQLDTCRDRYETAMNKISRGRGNLISQAGSFPDLGVRVKRRFPDSLTKDAAEPGVMPE